VRGRVDTDGVRVGEMVELLVGFTSSSIEELFLERLVLDC
jgi:hypothetical protein